MYMNANMPPMMQQMMKGMLGTFGEQMGEDIQKETEKVVGESEALSTSLQSELVQELDYERYVEKSKAMGEGVRFVSAEKLSDRIDKMGVQVVYAFRDIRNLKLTFMPTEMPSDSSHSESSRKHPITFDYKQGKPAQLIINIPQEKTAEVAEPAPVPPSDVAGETSPMQVNLMKKFFDGFRVRMMVTVVGDITETNALHVAKKTGLDEGDTVVLMDMNIGGMLNNPEGLDKLIAYGPIQNVDEARTRLQHIEELKFETSNQVAVFFQ